MIEITRDSLDNANYEDKLYEKVKKESFIKNFIKENKVLIYMIGMLFILTISNAVLIFSFFKILEKI